MMVISTGVFTCSIEPSGNSIVEMPAGNTFGSPAPPEEHEVKIIIAGKITIKAMMVNNIVCFFILLPLFFGIIQQVHVEIVKVSHLAKPQRNDN
jgi:hypothetical protein